MSKRSPPKKTKSSKAPRKGSLEETIRTLDGEAFKSYGMSKSEIKKALLPNLAFHFGLVEHGFELRIFDDGKYLGAISRDFSDSHNVARLKELLFKQIAQAIKRWRNKL